MRNPRANPPGPSHLPVAAWARRLPFAAAAALVLVPAVLACRYNVRDLGFIDVPAEDYRLVAVFADESPQPVLTAEQQRLEKALLDANVQPTVLRRQELTGSPVARDLPDSMPGPLPARWLVSPDHFATNLAALTPPPGNAEALLRGSPTRDALAEVCARAFGAILLIEGTDPTANQAAADTIRRAIAEIRDGMADLPKAIVAPPERVTLKAANIPAERILCWSLGLSAEPAPSPRVAVFYGKSRWIGPLMEGRHITVENLARLFWIIGADCECGMDLAWTRGTMLPLRWTQTLHASAAKSLGFDPASPLVRAEALRIINRYSRGLRGERYLARANPATPTPAITADNPSSATNEPAAQPSQPIPPLETTPPSAHATNVADRVPTPTATAPNIAPAAPDTHLQHDEERSQAVTRRVVLVMAFIGLVVLLGAGFILLLPTRRWHQPPPTRPRPSAPTDEDEEEQ